MPRLQGYIIFSVNFFFVVASFPVPAIAKQKLKKHLEKTSNLQTAGKCDHAQPHSPCLGLSEHFWSALPRVSQGRGQFGKQMTTNLPFLADARRSGFLFLSPTSKGKRWRCSRRWLLLPVSTAGSTVLGGVQSTGKQGPSVGAWDPPQGHEATAKTAMFWTWAVSSENSNDQDSHLPSHVCSQRIPFPHQTKTMGQWWVRGVEPV